MATPVRHRNYGDQVALPADHIERNSHTSRTDKRQIRQEKQAEISDADCVCKSLGVIALVFAIVKGITGI